MWTRPNLTAKAESGASSEAAAKPDGEDEGGAAGTILTNGRPPD